MNRPELSHHRMLLPVGTEGGLEVVIDHRQIVVGADCRVLLTLAVARRGVAAAAVRQGLQPVGSARRARPGACAPDPGTSHRSPRAVRSRCSERSSARTRGRAEASGAADVFGRRRLLLYTIFGYTIFTGLIAIAPGERTFVAFEIIARAFAGAEAAIAVNNNAAGVLLALASIARGRDVVFPHAKLAYETVPQMPGAYVPSAMTTGACTVPNYIAKKAGLKAQFHHVLGATIVEADAVVKGQTASSSGTVASPKRLIPARSPSALRNARPTTIPTSSTV